MADVIYTRSSKAYEKTVEKLRKESIEAARREQRRKRAAVRKAASAKNSKFLISADALKTGSQSAGAGRRKKNKLYSGAPAKQGKNGKNKKVKRRSVWTVSGGAFETNRRRH